MAEGRTYRDLPAPVSSEGRWRRHSGHIFGKLASRLRQAIIGGDGGVHLLRCENEYHVSQLSRAACLVTGGLRSGPMFATRDLGGLHDD